MRLATVAAVALILSVFLLIFGCTDNGGTYPSVSTNNGSNGNQGSYACPPGYTLGSDAMCHLENSANGSEGGAIKQLGGGQTGQNATGQTTPSNIPLPAATDQQTEFSDIVCSTFPSSATHLTGGEVAVNISPDLQSELASQGDSISFASPQGFVNQSESTTSDYYWDCWTNYTGDHTCIIPITATWQDGSGNNVTNTGAIVLTFTGPLAPLLSANPPQNNSAGQVPIVEGAPSGAPQGRAYPDSAPVLGAGETGPTDVGTVQRFGPQYVCPVSENSEGGAESGPMDVEPAYMFPHWIYWIPLNEQTINNCPGPMLPAATFTMTNCQVLFDQSCPQQEGMQLCGECPYANTIAVVHPDATHQQSQFAANLGQCRYCGAGSTCGSNDNYGICGSVCIGSSPAPGPMNFYIGCSECPDGSIVSQNYPDRSYDSWADCMNEYDYCYDTLGCGKVLENCRGHEPS
jgi:hypothetical protein